MKHNHWLLTHSYDKLISKDLITKINSINITNRDGIELLRGKIKEPVAVSYFEKMLSDNNNYDPINNLDSIKLLNIVGIISQTNIEIIELLEEQLKDLQTGFCPQGRTIRLIQIIQPYLDCIDINNIKEIENISKDE